MAKQTKKQAVERRTHERLAVRKEAAQRGAETRRRKREVPEQTESATQPTQLQGQQPESVQQQTKRPEASTARKSDSPGAMATVALRGEQAERFRALAAAQEMSLSKLLVRMMEVFEAQVG